MHNSAMRRIQQLVFLVISILHFCKAANIRLVGGSNNTEGRVEVFYDGKWGTVCHDGWDLNDANVVCRSLGLPRAVEALHSAAFGQGSGPIWMGDVRCSGSESSLFQCQHRGWGLNNCGNNHYYDAGVVCGLPPLIKLNITNPAGVISSPVYPNVMERANYEWTFRPPTIPRGRVAVYFEDLDLIRSHGKSNLKVVDATNTQLLYASNVKRRFASALIETTIGKLIYSSSFTPKYGSRGKGFNLRYYTFSMAENNQACNRDWNWSFVQDGPGRINISWSHVPHGILPFGPSFTYLALYKVVKSLHSEVTTLNVSLGSAAIDFLHPNRTYSIRLVAFDTSNIVNTTIHSCPQLVNTDDVRLRLVGGKLSSEGRVEVFYHGIWGTICTDWWNLNDAKVVCRSLGLPAASYAMSYHEFSSESSSQVWMTELRCSGNEESLAYCPYQGHWAHIPSHCSYSFFTASVICGHPQVFNINITDLFGEITSPGYPQHMLQAHYVWTFRPSLRNANIAIYFEDLDLNGYNYGQRYVNVKDSSGHQLFYLSNTRASPLGVMIQNKTGIMTFYSSFTTSHGKGIRVRYLAFDRSLDDAITQNASILVSSTSPHSISVGCGSFTVDDFKVLGYLITCNSTDDWHRTVSYAIADNKTKFGSCHRLIGLTNYKVQVFAVGTNVTDGNMVYKSKVVEIRTVEGVPSNPQGLRAVSSTTTTIHIQWNPIPRARSHGVLLGYKVYYRDDEYYHSKTITTNDTDIILEHLFPGMNYYYIYVRGITSKGQGQEAGLWGQKTKCGGIEDKKQGTMNHPRYYRNYWRRPWSINCMWTLRASSDTGMIVVLLETVDVPLSPGCSSFYVALLNNNGQTAHKFCGGRRQSLTFISFGTAKLKSYQVGWPGNRRFIMKAKYYVFANGFNVPVESTWNISAKSISSSAINVQWSEYPLSRNLPASTQVVSYLAVCIAVSNHTNISVASTNGTGRSVNVSHLGWFTDYYVQLIAVLGNSTIAVRNEIYFQRSKNMTVQTMEHAPSQPPVNIFAQIRTSNHILVKWDSFPGEYVHGILLGYHVYYQPTLSSNNSHERMSFVHANKTSVMLQNLGYLTEYRIRVAGVTQAGEGPRSRAVFVMTGLDCDENLSRRHGTFSSPNYPSNYPSDANCAWTIGKGMEFDDKLIVLFNSFELEDINYVICSNDYVSIVDIKGNELGQGKYCGKKSPFAVVSLRSAKVILHSDKAYEKKGFNATYFVIDKYSKDFDLKVKSVTTTKLMLVIEDLGVKFTELVVLYKEKENQTTWNVSTKSSLNITIRGLLPSKEYEVRALGYFNERVYKSLVTIVTPQLPTTSPTEEPPTTKPLKELEMYDYGPSAGDSVVPHTWGDLQRCFGVELNEDGITILMKRYHKLYICHNGVIRFGAHFFPRWPKPFSGSTEGCKLELAMLAPYWATTDPYSFYQPRISAVYYQMYTSSQKNCKVHKCYKPGHIRSSQTIHFRSQGTLQ